jgi:DNA-binding CsgD family transcriptional regulator
MAAITLGRTLGASVALVAVLNTLSALSLPVMSRRPATTTVVAWLILLSVHAALYWWGVPIRARFRLPVYVAAQAVTLFGLIVSGAPVPVALGLLMTFTAEVVLLAGARWGTIPITAGAITLYVTAAIVSSNLYRAATAGLALAVTGAMAHGLAALFRRPAVPPTDSVPSPSPSPGTTPAPSPAVGTQASLSAVAATAPSQLSVRETEVLTELVRGSKNAEIAATLGISERTVKAHLANIYMKLGVESRSGAAAVAVQRRLI